MLEIPRFVLLVAILSVASYHDIRNREIPDHVWMIGGALGAILYAFDWGDVDLFVLFSIVSGLAIALVMWRFFPMGGADVLAVMTVSVTYPVSFGTVMNPAVVFFGGLILEHLAAFFYNVRYNVQDLTRGNSLFSDVTNSWATKVMAFYSVHRKRNHERFVFCAETVTRDGRRKITLRTPGADSQYETRTGVFVTWAMPALPFMLASLVAGAAVSAFFAGFY